MSYINQNSLSKTLDNLNDVLFFGKKFTAAEKLSAARWLASRQGLEGSYAGMFAPTLYDFRNRVTLYTGEKLTTGASIGHILGEETCRMIHLLDVKDKEITRALHAAKHNFRKAIASYISKQRAISKVYKPNGTYCCGKCSVAYWRNLASEGVNKNKAILNAGLKILKMYRDGQGKWRRFPFYYTLSALIEIKIPLARNEILYALPACERALKSISGTDIISRRRKKLLEKTLVAG